MKKTIILSTAFSLVSSCGFQTPEILTQEKTKQEVIQQSFVAEKSDNKADTNVFKVSAVTNKVVFVSDFPADFTTFSPGKKFVAEFKFKALVDQYIGKANLVKSTNNGVLSDSKSISIYKGLKKGEVFTISAPMTAPISSGNYRDSYQLVDLFGNNIAGGNFFKDIFVNQLGLEKSIDAKIMLQSDSRWSESNVNGTSTKIKNSLGSLVSLTVAVNYLNGTKLTPIDVDKTLKTKGGYTSSSTIQFNKVPNLFYGSYDYKNNLTKTFEGWKNGIYYNKISTFAGSEPIIAKLNTGRFVLIIGQKSNSYIVMDPNVGVRTLSLSDFAEEFHMYQTLHS